MRWTTAPITPAIPRPDAAQSGTPLAIAAGGRVGSCRRGRRPLLDRRNQWRKTIKPPIDSIMAAGTQVIRPPIICPVNTLKVKARPQISKIG